MKQGQALPEHTYSQDVRDYLGILNRFKNLQENQYTVAYTLSQDALIEYNRWSEIFFEVRRSELYQTKDPAWKDRSEDIMKVLHDVYVSSRMIWSHGESEMRETRS